MLKNGRCYSRISTAINVLDPQATTPIWINDADASPIMILLRGESGRRWSNCSNWISSQRTRILLFQYYGALCFHPKSKQGQWYEVTSHVNPSGKSLQDLAVVSPLSHDDAPGRSVCASGVGLSRNLYSGSSKNGNTTMLSITWGELDGVYHIVSPRLHGCFISARVPFQDTTDQSGRRGRRYLLRKDGVNVLGNILISFSEWIEGFKRDQNEESLQSLVEDQKDLVTYLYKTPVVSTIFALPSFTSLFRAHRYSPKPVHWMDITYRRDRRASDKIDGSRVRVNK